MFKTRFHGISVFDDRRTLEANVFGDGVAKAGLTARGRGAQDFAQPIELNLLGNIVEHQSDEGAF